MHHLSLGLLQAGQAPHDTLGAASLVQVAGCLLGLTRQGAAILAVLEPQSAGALHARMRAFIDSMSCGARTIMVCETPEGGLRGVAGEVRRGRALRCAHCGKRGASLGCRLASCHSSFHVACAQAAGASFFLGSFQVACKAHARLFGGEPSVPKLLGLMLDAETMRPIASPSGGKKLMASPPLRAQRFPGEKGDRAAGRRAEVLQARAALRAWREEERRQRELSSSDEEHLRSREAQWEEREIASLQPVLLGAEPQGEGDGLCTRPLTTFADVAGMEGVKAALREMVLLPLLAPQVLQDMGISAPRQGKTLIVRALAGECAAFAASRVSLFVRSGADCLGKFHGEAERTLRLLFEEATRRAPSIIFFDELDALAPARTARHDSPSDQTFASVVSTLLCLMDGVGNRGAVVVIGATNSPDSLDPALRRPGRFDREVEVGLPSSRERLGAVESFLAGYRIEHVVLALQMFICIIVAMLPVLTDRAYRDLDEAATFWTVIAAAVVLEPCTGNVLRKFVVRMLAVGLATSMGVLVLYISFAICHTEPDQAPRNFPLFGHMVSIGLAFCAALIMLHRQRWAQEYEYAFFLSLLSLCVVTVPALRQTPGDALSDAGYRALNIVIGVAISAVVAFAIFPIKARSLLRKQTAVALMQAGDLAAWVFTQVGVEPTAKDSNALPHASGTDKSMRYIDDGLQVEMAPLFAATQRLAVSLAGLDDLLRSARAEVNLFSRPHRFPSKTYGALLSSLHTSVGLLQTQLYFMATGNFSLGAIRHHAGPICDAGVQLSILLAALAGEGGTDSLDRDFNGPGPNGLSRRSPFVPSGSALCSSTDLRHSLPPPCIRLLLWGPVTSGSGGAGDVAACLLELFCRDAGFAVHALTLPSLITAGDSRGAEGLAAGLGPALQPLLRPGLQHPSLLHLPDLSAWAVGDDGEGLGASPAWTTFVVAVQGAARGTPALILATARGPADALPHDVQDFFDVQLLCPGSSMREGVVLAHPAGQEGWSSPPSQPATDAPANEALLADSSRPTDGMSEEAMPRAPASQLPEPETPNVTTNEADLAAGLALYHAELSSLQEVGLWLARDPRLALLEATPGRPERQRSKRRRGITPPSVPRVARRCWQGLYGSVEAFLLDFRAAVAEIHATPSGGDSHGYSPQVAAACALADEVEQRCHENMQSLELDNPHLQALRAVGAWARLEGVNQPNLLPQGSEITPLIDVANFLTETEETRMRDRLQHLEKDTGIKFRVLAQNYPDTPGLAIKDYWSVDDNTVVLVADPTFGNVLNFNIGINIDSFIPRNFWSKVAGRFGNKFYVEEQGRDVAIINAVAAVDHCLREPIDRTQCSEIRGEL
ncbi:hypothetical protein APUTEX25_002061, partial [Auxenochlorella protothecoides]